MEFFTRLRRRRDAVADGAPPVQQPPAGDLAGFWTLPDGGSAARLTAAQLTELENRDVPAAGRASDAEATADEKQDLTTSLNFPLHWTSATESWHYLFDFAVACQLLAQARRSRARCRGRDVLGVGAALAARHPNGLGRSLGRDDEPRSSPARG